MAGKSFFLMKLLAKRRRNKIIILAIGGVGAVAAGLLLYSFSWPFSALSHWPHVPPPELFVTIQPKQDDIPGTYLLTRQTITTNGLAVLEGRQCHLDLRPDGAFSVTNYPRWSPDDDSTKPHVVAFISTTGHWHCDTTINISYNGRPCWGVGFSDPRIDALALRSKGAPYDLMLTFGDGDDGTVMLFERK